MKVFHAGLIAQTWKLEAKNRKLAKPIEVDDYDQFVLHNTSPIMQKSTSLQIERVHFTALLLMNHYRLKSKILVDNIQTDVKYAISSTTSCNYISDIIF